MTKEVIESNKNEFIDIFKKTIIPHYIGADKLLEWICGTDFFTAPASTRYHMSEEGGLCQHTLNVYRRLMKLVKDNHGEKYLDIVQTEDCSLALVALCHDLCKCQSYEKDYRNKKHYSEKGSKSDEKGRFDWVVEEFWVKNERFVYGHGAKSVYIIQNFLSAGLALDEAVAIRYHMGGHELGNPYITEIEQIEAYNKYPLAFYLHMADMMATYVDERSVEEDA